MRPGPWRVSHRCAEPARGIEGLVVVAVEREMLELLERWHLLEFALTIALAGVEVFVDEPVGAQVRLYLRRVGRKLGQCADAHMHIVQGVETGRG